jgi:hypothetical protein
MHEVIPHIHGKPRVSRSLKDEDVLWRYLDVAKFLDFIHNHTLFFSRGDQFEDKFEGAFTDSLKHGIELAYKENNIDFSYEEFRSRLRERVFVNCWHQSVDDSMAMWSISGRSSCSVAITATVGQLRKSLEDQDLHYLIYIEKVEYVNHWDDPKLDLRPYSRVFAYKNKAYEFEKEVRILIDRFDEFETPMTDTGMPIKVTPQTLLHSIVIAPEAPPWFETLVRAVSERYEIIARVHRSFLAKEPV